MVFNLARLVLFIALIKTIKADSYYPCKSYISFSYDDSNTLSSDDFKIQMNFIRNVIASINYPNRLRTEGAFTGEFNWNSGLTLAQMQSAIDNAFQTSNQYSLLQQAASLLTSVEVLDESKDPIAALIFISDTSDAALRNADRWFAKLNNVVITFVLLGTNVDSLKLRQFSKSFIYWPDLSQPEPDNWDLLSYHAFGCSTSSTTSPPTTISPSQSPTSSTLASPSTSQPTHYNPCRSNIVFAMDASSSMGDAEFRSMQQLITNNIVAKNWTHFERVGLMPYADTFYYTYKYGKFGSKADFDNTIKNNISRFPNANSITFGMGTLLSTFSDIPLGIQNSIFFTSTSDPDDVAKAAAYSHIVDQRGALIIVAVSPANKQALLPLVAGDESKIIEFNVVSGIDYNTYAEAILKQFYCGGSTTGSTPTSTVTYPSVPYVPCQSWIHFGIDDSNVLQDNDFTTQISFIANAIGNITHPERIAAAGIYSQPVPWNSGLSIPQIQNAISGMFQGGPYMLRNQFAALLINLQDIQTGNIPVGALIFISDTSDAALVGADQFFNQLAGLRITFVLLGNNVDSSKIAKFSSDFIYWTDLSQPQPDNWGSSYPSAYSCQS